MEKSIAVYNTIDVCGALAMCSRRYPGVNYSALNVPGICDVLGACGTLGNSHACGSYPGYLFAIYSCSVVP